MHDLKKQASFDDNFLEYDADIFLGGLSSRLMREEVNPDEVELNLTLSDIDYFDEPMPLLFDVDGRQTEDMAENEMNSCCHKDSSDKDWDANESTFISYLPEPDQSLDIFPFD